MAAVGLQAAQPVLLQAPCPIEQRSLAHREQDAGRRAEHPQQQRYQPDVHAIEQPQRDFVQDKPALRNEAEHRVHFRAAQLRMSGKRERRGKPHPLAGLQPGDVLPHEKPEAVERETNPREHQGGAEQPDRASLNPKPHVCRILAVKLHASPPGAVNTFTGYGEGYVMVNAERRETSVVVLPERVVAWPAKGFDALTLEDFSFVLELKPEIVLLGTGGRQRFPHPRLTRALAQAGVGVEVMDVQAACRTYNILVAEERRVAAALLFA